MEEAMRKNDRPLVFVGSSAEGLHVAEALKQGLGDRVAEVELWSEGIFRPTQSTLGNLLNLLERVDFAVLVLTSDDTVRTRGRQKKVARDNVLFELGLMLGALGPERTVFVVPREAPPNLCSDLAGITPIKYSKPSKGSWQAALGSTCTTIKQLLSDVASHREVGIRADPGKWSYRFPERYPMTALFLQTGPESQRHLIERVEDATQRITAFGLTRNFLLSPEMRDILMKKAHEIPITLYLMAPSCASRKDRYRIEPMEAAMEDPSRFKREVLAPLKELILQVQQAKPKRGAGLRAYLYNFPCSFSIEEIDDVCRVTLYGHGKRGTEGPIFVFREGTPYFHYFISQLRWLESIASGKLQKPWVQKKIKVRPFP